jgi:hypothetical protein
MEMVVLPTRAHTHAQTHTHAHPLIHTDAHTHPCTNPAPPPIQMIKQTYEHTDIRAHLHTQETYTCHALHILIHSHTHKHTHTRTHAHTQHVVISSVWFQICEYVIRRTFTIWCLSTYVPSVYYPN